LGNDLLSTDEPLHHHIQQLLLQWPVTSKKCPGHYLLLLSTAQPVALHLVKYIAIGRNEGFLNYSITASN
jgi:hypothetical protein